METITIKRKITNEKVKVLKECDVGKVTLYYYWDSHGYAIPDDTQIMKKCHIKLQERSWTEFGKKWNTIEAFINNEPIDGEITKVTGNLKSLTLYSCIGWG